MFAAHDCRDTVRCCRNSKYFPFKPTGYQRGLNFSEKCLNSFGNTSAALGAAVYVAHCTNFHAQLQKISICITARHLFASDFHQRIHLLSFYGRNSLTDKTTAKHTRRHATFTVARSTAQFATEATFYTPKVCSVFFVENLIHCYSWIREESCDWMHVGHRCRCTSTVCTVHQCAVTRCEADAAAAVLQLSPTGPVSGSEPRVTESQYNNGANLERVRESCRYLIKTN